MPSGHIEYWLFLTYLLVGPLTWLYYGAVLRGGRRRMMLLRRPMRPVTVEPQPITVLIPAKDEGARIRACLESALRQDYPDFQVVAIDDRSTDQTGNVMDELAATEPRLKVIHINDPPAQGWTGKNHALHIGSKHAIGRWLVFVDSDVVLESDILINCFRTVVDKRLDMLSLLPRLECESFWERLLVPLGAGAAAGMLLIALANTQANKTAFANGQFIMITRAAYDAIGGHEIVRDRLCEDVAIARQVKARGYRPRISWGNDFASVRMFDSLPAILRGWARILYGATVGSPWRILAATGFLVLCTFSAYAAIAWGAYRIHSPGPYDWICPSIVWFSAALVHVLAVMIAIGSIYHWSGNRTRNALLFFPLAAPMLLYIFVKALKMCATRKVEWRGVSYSHTMVSTLARQ